MSHLSGLLFLVANADSSRNAIDSVHRVAGAIIADVATGRGIDKMEMLIEKLVNWGIIIGGRIIGATIIFFVGRFVIRMINKVFDKVLTRDSIDPGVKSFLKSMINALLMVLLIIAIVNKLGFETTSFAALLASFGVAVGMALSGNLSNFVGGMIILMFKPYRVGDLIEVNGVTGYVEAIEIFHTILRTYSGENVYLSNGNMSAATIKNYHKEDRLRLEFKVGVEYGQDFKQAEDVLLKLANEDARVLKDPKPYVALDELADSSVNLVMRLWVENADYWSTKYDINRKIYERFNEAGISFPFPQITVHKGDPS